MDNFYEILNKRECSDIIMPSVYSYQGFRNENELFSAFDNIIKNNKRVLIHGDSDADGLMSLFIVREMFDRVGFSNYEVFNYVFKTHNIPDEAVSKAIQEHFDYIVILDSSTNDFSNINKLLLFGVKPIILDHHIPTLDYENYPNDCVIINSVLENRHRGVDFYQVSAGALCFSLCSRFLELRGLKWMDLSLYALVSLYSDSIDMSSNFNRGIYYLATSLSHAEIPRCISGFMRSYDVICRRFIEYTFAPKINAMFRAERFDLLNKYMNTRLAFPGSDRLVEDIESLHEFSRTLVARVSDSIDVENLQNIVIGSITPDLLPINTNKLYNYTGLVANSLSKEYGKPAVVLCDTGRGVKGSFRDLLSRNYLSKFKQFCDANGHGAAFGINIKYVELSDFLWYLHEKIDKRFFILGVDDVIEIEYNESLPDLKLLNDIALYNEFSGVVNPIVLLNKRNNLKSQYAYKRGSYNYKWGDLKVESSYVVPPGDLLQIKPIVTKRLKLVTYSRNIMI